MDTACVVLGGGQHAKVVIDTMHAAGLFAPIAILDCNRELWGQSLLGVPVVGGDEHLVKLVKEGVTHFVVGIGSTSSTDARRKLFEFGIQHGLKPLMVRHPSAICSAAASFEPGSQVFAGAIVNTSARIEGNVIINTGAIVEHDCIVRAHAHIATGARLAGAVQVGRGAHIGIGASIRQGTIIGDRAVVGAGAVVVDDVASDLIVVGVPARVLRRLAA